MTCLKKSITLKRFLLIFWDIFWDTVTFLELSFAKLRDRYFRAFHAAPTIIGIDETLKTISKEKPSFCRYGDGEFKLMRGFDISFQDASPEMTQRLRDIIKTEDDGFFVCIPDIFKSLDMYVPEAKSHWKRHLASHRKALYSMLGEHKTYYDSFLSRPYMQYEDKSNSRQRFDLLRKLWDSRDVVIIEGRQSRLGVGNNLFDNVKSIRRILCPIEDAYSQYNTILSEAKKVSRDCLILIALGPAATILAYDLFKDGYQAMDIGHVDIEYEWFLIGATKKVPVKDKYVNEAGQGENVGDITNEDYLSEILVTIISN